MYEDRVRRAAGAAKILVIVFVVIALVCSGYVIYFAKTWKGRVAQSIRDGLIPEIQATALPDDQKEGLAKTLRQVADGLDVDEVSLDQMATIARKMSEDGPFMSLILVETIKARFVEKIEADGATQAENDLLFDRFERGIAEGDISDEQITTVLAHVSETKEDKVIKLKEAMTQEELTAFMDEMTKAVNDANIEEEPYQYDFANELAKIVDEVLGSKLAASQPATAPATQPE
jgi:hypothetical protein